MLKNKPTIDSRLKCNSY